jgi:hypothetical protein
MAQQQEFKPLTGSDRDKLLNTNARVTLEKMGRKDWADAMEQAAQMTEGKVQPYEIFTTVSRESNFNPAAKSHSSSASGLGQFVKKTAEAMGINNPQDPIQSIHGIGKYLSSIKQGGISDPAEAQKAYMLGEAGYRNWQKGRNVAGAGDISGLSKKFERDIGALSGGNYDIKGLKTQGVDNMSVPENSDRMAIHNMATPTENPMSRYEAVMAIQSELDNKKKRNKQEVDDLRRVAGQSELNSTVSGLSGL